METFLASGLISFTSVTVYPKYETVTIQLNALARYPEFQQDLRSYEQPLRSDHAPEHLDVGCQKFDVKSDSPIAIL